MTSQDTATSPSSGEPAAVPLRLLNVEDDENDSLLIVHELRRGGFAPLCRRVETEADLRSALRECPWDVVITDFALPTLAAPDVLRIVIDVVGDRVPIIVVSGTVAEDVAVELMRSGACDYLSKDGLRRLAPAVRRELAEAEQRRRRAEAERQIRLSSLLLDAATDAIVAETVEGPIHYANRTAQESFGLGTPEKGRQLRQIVDPPALAAWDRWYSLLKPDNVIRFESSLRRTTGVALPVEVTARLVDVDGTTFVLSSFHDLTERQRAERELRDTEDQLHQAQKMEAIGTLAGGIAHDFNNLLGAILGHADFALDEVPADNPGREDLEQISTIANRAAALTAQLLAFGRRQILRIASLDVNRVVTETEKMLRRVIGEDVRLVCVLDPSLKPLMADQSRIEQILLNLAVNARDAMPQGGTITVETHARRVESPAAAHSQGVQPGEYVELSVRDTGTGMDEATKARIFEPFFTTKPVGKGTGLGLSTVYGIVKQFDGHITVESAPGTGTVFRILLPAGADKAVPAELEPARIESATPLRQATILLVEDDERLRTVIDKALRKRGYKILSADGGEAALRLFDAPGTTVDLLLTDVVMPRMSGARLADELRKRRPDLKVVYTSGYTDNAIVHHGVLQPDTIFIQKPFRMADLISLLQDVLR